MTRSVLFILDLDRVIFDTERLYRTNHTEFAPYPEDEGALVKLKRFGPLCVFSEITIHGSRELQESKIKKLKIDKHAANDDIYILENKVAKLPEILKSYRHGLIFLVDDRIEVLEAAEKIDERIVTVWVQRGIHAEAAMKKKKTFKTDLVVFNLNELADMVPKIITKN